MRRTLSVRFWAKVQRVDVNDSCWIWTGSRNEKGYGKITLGTRGQGTERAHRVSWMLHYGDIPEDKCVLHRCDNPPCVRPDHLFLGTKKDNTADMMSKGRMKAPPIHIGDNHPLRRNPEFAARGERNGNSRYTDEDALTVLKISGTYDEIALVTGLSRNFVASVKSGKGWRHVTQNQSSGS